MRDRKIDRQEIDHADFAEHQIGHQYTSPRRWKQIVTNAGKDDTMRKRADKNTPTTEQ